MTAMGLFILHCSLFISGATAQVKVEYWIDSDPGRGKATVVTASVDGEGNILFDAPTTGLAAGHHLLGVRAYNASGENTSFSPTLLNEFIVPDVMTITRVEYFWDSDPGRGKATPLSITNGNELNIDDLTIPTTGLTGGTHLLGLRAHGNNGWSPTVHQTVIVSPTEEELAITRVEYFWDSDPGFGKGMPLAVVSGSDLNLDNVEIPTNDLTSGRHQLGVRAYGCNGWSPTVWLSTIAKPLITKAEYFWDEDPGFGAGTPIDITPGQEVTLNGLGISTDGLSAGRHQWFIRYRGVLGWSPTLCNDVIVMPETTVSKAEYFWNEDPGYGKGTPLNITPAEELTLENLGIPTTEVHGDALFFIRYRGPFGWSPTLCYKILVDAEGNYTLNALAETSIDTRNYQSLADAFSDFADRGVGNDITLTLPTTGTDYAFDATTDEALAQVAAISESIDRVSSDREAKTIGFKASEGSGNTLTVTTTDEGLPTVVSLFARTWQENVALTINGTAYDFTSFAQAPRYEELCSEVATTPVSITAPANGTTVSFTAQPQQGTKLSGFTADPVSELSAMTIVNSGSTTEALPYHVALLDGNDTELAAYTYYIYVRPRVSIQTFSGMSPATGSSLDPVATTLKWNAVPGAEGYRLTITDTTGDTPVTVLDGSPIETTAYTLTVESGHSYSWQVTAIGPCDELDSPVMTFEGRLLPDLAVTSITMPEAAEAGNTITVTATVVNQGEGATTEGSWTDRLYYVIDSEDFAQAVQASEQTHSGNLAAGASYDLTFQLKVPQNDNGQLRVFIVTDAKAKVMESNDNNNRTLSAAATLKPFYMNTTDLAALRQLYTDFGGAQWNGTQWNTASELITPDNWSGVTFNTEGCVTAINLQGRGLAGSFSDATTTTLSQLKTLNLSRNSLTGDPALIVTAAGLPLLTTLNLAYNQIDELSAALPSTITSLDLSYQHRQYGNNSVLPGFDQLTPKVLNIGSSMTVSLPAPALYSHSAQSFNTHPQLYVYSRDLNTRYGTLNWSATYETYAYAHSSNWLHSMEQDAEVVLMPADGTPMNHSVWPAQMHFTLGDANLTGLVDVNDVQRTLNYVINQNNTTTFGLWAANTFTEDETTVVINIQDIVCTVNIVLANEGTSASRRLVPSASQVPEDPASPNCFYAEGRKLMLQAEDEVAAFCLELAGVSASQVKLLLPARDWQMQTHDTDGGLRLVVFSPTGQTLSTGTTQLLRLSADGVWPVSATASSAEAEPLSVSVNSDASMGIEYVDDVQQQSRDVYDLLGRKVNSDRQLRKGVYIQNGKKVKR